MRTLLLASQPCLTLFLGFLLAFAQYTTLPAAAQGAAVRFLFWQPAVQLADYDVWTLDEVHLGHSSGLATINESFVAAELNDRFFESAPHSVIEETCGRPALHFLTSGATDAQAYLDTRPLTLPAAGAYIQLELSTGCTRAAPTSDFYLTIEASDNGGSWRNVFAACNPLSSSCKEWPWTGIERLDAHEYVGGYTRVTAALPDGQPGNRRFRIRGVAPSGGSSPMDFALAYIYIGAGCGGGIGCGPHGRCIAETICACDKGFGRSNSSDSASGICVPTTSALTLRDTFEDELLPSKWAKVVAGATAASNCGEVAGGRSLEFRNAGSRRAETVDLNLRQAYFLQFTLLFGTSAYQSACRAPTSSTSGIVVAYSTTGGAMWTLLQQNYYRFASRPSTLVLLLPAGAMTPATRIMVWQPTRSAAEYNVWAVDDVYIGPGSPALLPTEAALALPAALPLPESAFLFHTSALSTVFCDRDALLFSSDTGTYNLDTNVLRVVDGAVLQVELATGCAASAPARAFSVHLQYLDEDKTAFQDLHRLECSPTASSSCTSWRADGSTTYSAYDFVSGWARIAWPLDAAPARRFRLTVSTLSATTTFAVNTLYIGNATPSACSGRGIYRNGSCACDAGFTSTDGECLPLAPRAVELRENFNDEILSSRWLRLLGGSQVADGGGCGAVGEALALRFDGVGTRLLETVDFNTTSARFVQFVLQLGSVYGSSSCRTPNAANKGVVFAYSVDGGLHWQQLEYVVGGSYLAARPRVVVLPQAARTPSTRFKWWQPTHYASAGYDVWLVDDVYLGPPPSSLELAELQDDFDATDETNFLTLHGSRVAEYCASEGQAAVFDAAAVGQLTLETRDLHLVLDEVVVVSRPLPETPHAPLWDAAASSGQTYEQGCGLNTLGYVYRGTGPARQLQTLALDVSAVNLQLSFYLTIGGGGCDGVESSRSRDEDVHLHYSVDNGDTWVAIAKYGMTTGQVSVTLTESMRTRATLFRWAQMEYTTTAPNSDVWAIADIEVGTSSNSGNKGGRGEVGMKRNGKKKKWHWRGQGL